MDAMDTIGVYLNQIPYFPILHTVHSLATTSSIRSQPGSLEFAHKHPLASLAGNTMIISAGGIMVSAALGKPPVGPFGNVLNTLTAILMWWLVYFGPGDFAFKLYRMKPVQILLMPIRELRRCKKILWAVNSAAAIFEGQWILMILVGALGGCSGKFLQTTEESIRKHSAEISKGEFLQVSFVTKASLFIAAIISLTKIGVLPFTAAESLFICTTLLIFVNLGMTVVGLPDPFHPIANATWKVVSIASSGPVKSEVPVTNEDKKKDN